MKQLLFIFLLLYGLSISAQVDSTLIQQPVEEEVYREVDEEPQYIGGTAAMFKFIRENMDYTKVEVDEELDTRVFLSIIVEKDGSLSHITPMKEGNASLIAESIRVIEAMPKWIPGRKNGKIVRTEMWLPIRIELK